LNIRNDFIAERPKLLYDSTDKEFPFFVSSSQKVLSLAGPGKRQHAWPCFNDEY